MWLEVHAWDESGRVLLASGETDAPGALVSGTRTFTTEGMNTEFHFTSDAWEVTGFSRNETIPAKGHRDVSFGMAPAKKQGMVTIEARLRYRQADQAVLNKLLQAVPTDIDLQATYGITTAPILPVVDMVVKKTSFSSKQ